MRTIDFLKKYICKLRDSSNKNNLVNTVFFPKSFNELHEFLNIKVRNNFLIISNDLEIVLYCNSKNYPIIQEHDLVDSTKFKKIKSGKFYGKWLDYLNKEKLIIANDYLNCFEYSISSQIKTIFYCRLLIEGLYEKYSFTNVCFFQNENSKSYARDNLLSFKYFILQNLFDNSKLKFLKRKYKIKYRFELFLLKTISDNIIIFNFIEVLFKSVKNRISILNFFKIIFNKINSAKLLFIGAGRDTTFHDTLISHTKFKSIVANGTSRHDINVKGRSNVSQNLNLYELNFAGCFRNMKKNHKTLQVEHFKVLFKILGLDLKETNSFNVFIYYVRFRYLREQQQIIAFRNAFKIIKPKIVFTTSLFIPSLAAKLEGIQVITQAEGLGIDLNPIAPCHGDIILSPSKCFEDQVKYQSREVGLIKIIGAYYDL